MYYYYPPNDYIGSYLLSRSVLPPIFSPQKCLGVHVYWQEEEEGGCSVGFWKKKSRGCMSSLILAEAKIMTIHGYLIK